MPVQFTRNRETGTYDVIGLPSEVRIGIVEATRKDGETAKVVVTQITRAFTAKYGPHKGESVVIGTVSRRQFGDGVGRYDPRFDCPECGASNPHADGGEGLCLVCGCHL